MPIKCVKYRDWTLHCNYTTNFCFLKVRARDFGVPPLSAEVPVTIYVQDVNDHSPMFQQMIYKRSIPEDMPGGTPILEVHWVKLNHLYIVIFSILDTATLEANIFKEYWKTWWVSLTQIKSDINNTLYSSR